MGTNFSSEDGGSMWTSKLGLMSHLRSPHGSHAEDQDQCLHFSDNLRSHTDTINLKIKN
jgi:hypothetical protein